MNSQIYVYTVGRKKLPGSINFRTWINFDEICKKSRFTVEGDSKHLQHTNEIIRVYSTCRKLFFKQKEKIGLVFRPDM